jgi:hypothetical protein
VDVESGEVFLDEPRIAEIRERAHHLVASSPL